MGMSTNLFIIYPEIIVLMAVDPFQAVEVIPAIDALSSFETAPII